MSEGRPGDQEVPDLSVDLLVDVAFFMQSKWEPDYRTVVEAAFHAMRAWPVEKRMEAMRMQRADHEVTDSHGWRQVITWMEADVTRERGSSA